MKDHRRRKGEHGMEKTIGHKQMLKLFLTIALPVALQNLLTYAVGLMDSIMVGSLGEVQLSAVTVAGQPFFLFMMCMFGLSSGACVLISQYWGKKDKDTISRIFGIVLRIAVLVGVGVTAVALLFPHGVMGLYTNEQPVIEYGVQYLRVVAFSYIPFAFTNGYLTCVRSVERVKIAVVTYSISFVVNVFFNYMFIFGKFGAPALGVAGAGVGTIIARAAELVIVLLYALKKETRVTLKWGYIVKNEKWILHDYMKFSMPVLVNEMMWAVGSSATTAILGRMSVSAVAAVSIVSTAFQIVTVFIYGAASATLVIVGKYIGERKFALARKSANWLVVANIVIAAATAAVFLLLKDTFMGFYTITLETREALDMTMVVAAVIILFYAVNMACIVGVFRGGGDTVFAMLLDIIAMWGVAVPLGALGAFAWGLSIPLVYFLLRSDEVVKAFVCLVRMKSGKWLRVVTRNADGTGGAGPMPPESSQVLE
ncbi:MATE family efflux transporter [Christensenella minuta]|uniref:MATE efflux family protein n=2 Tax=Christensenella minuta TaxID=626937 RepID=A0A136Q084_9FIRM|nr:MATE family efflux transporter [Christensenella minuta]KXK64098.1 MATE efflux family protein [Christensenella minuta]